MTTNKRPLVVVNDASCLIDLRKGALLDVLVRLPYQLVTPLPVRLSEVLDFSAQDWAILDHRGMVTYDLPSEHVAEAFAVKARYPRLSANDCFCLVTTRIFDEAVLLTGDAQLRRVATDDGCRVHGVFWIIEEARRHGVCDSSVLTTALDIWDADPTVFLRSADIERLRRALKAK